jgi:hypothetical protein
MEAAREQAKGMTRDYFALRQVLRGVGYPEGWGLLLATCVGVSSCMDGAQVLQEIHRGDLAKRLARWMQGTSPKEGEEDQWRNSESRDPHLL